MIARAAHALILLIEKYMDTIRFLNLSGLFHNDLAPQNILLSSISKDSYKLRIIDFGASFIDAKTAWEQPAIDFIDSWYAQRLCKPGLSLRDNTIRLRDSGISKDIYDWQNLKKTVTYMVSKNQAINK